MTWIQGSLSPVRDVVSVAALLIAVLLGACATPITALTARRHLATTAGPITICTAPEGPTDDATTVARSLDEAGPKLAKWGTLEKPVELYVMPTHGDLEWATHRHGYTWLRAWAQYDDVLMQAPSTWSSDDRDVVELLAHELTHCLMYQRSGTREDWVKKGIPLWFREGMATWTAEQGYRWMSLEDLARFYEERPPHDPIVDAETLYQHYSAPVYAAAYYAFTFLLNRYGTAAIERLMQVMADGETFDAAFQRAIGLAPPKFVAEFRRFVTWRGFRGNGKPVNASFSAVTPVARSAEAGLCPRPPAGARSPEAAPAETRSTSVPCRSPRRRTR
jgi:hypothetical protein